jgi:hypothetical protein
VRFAGVLGHLDRYESRTHRIRDTKTTSDRWLQHIKVHGASKQHIWQTHLYAAAVMQTGRRVREIVIDYLARDTGEDHQVVIPFDTKHVRDAMRWLDNVRQAPLDMLNRDYEPDSKFCAHCPFFKTCWDGAVPDRDLRSVLYVEDPDKTAWAQKLWDAREDKADATARENEAKGALDALRPVTDGSSDLIDVGLDHYLQWTVTTSHRLDTDAVRAEYAKTGAKPPEKESRSVRLAFVAKDGAS